MSRYVFLSLFSLLCFPAIGLSQGGGTTTPCFAQTTRDCAGMGLGYQGSCDNTNCLVLIDGSKLCPKDKGLAVFDSVYIYLDVIPATGNGSTQALPLGMPVACGVVTECHCTQTTLKCLVTPNTGVFFEPEEWVIGPFDCTGGGSGPGN